MGKAQQNEAPKASSRSLLSQSCPCVQLYACMVLIITRYPLAYSTIYSLFNRA